MQNTDALLDDRQRTHGEFAVHARITQEIKAIMHASPNWAGLPLTHREGLEMIAHKIGRALAGDYTFADHYADMQGYARLVERACQQVEDDIAAIARKFAPRSTSNPGGNQ
jgi:hypothetical protein